MDELAQLLSNLSNPLLTVCAIYIARSLQQLNIKMAVIVERVDSHEQRLKKLEK